MQVCKRAEDNLAEQPNAMLRKSGAGEGNRTLDIQLGKLLGNQAKQYLSCKTLPYRPQSLQRVTGGTQNQTAIPLWEVVVAECSRAHSSQERELRKLSGDPHNRNVAGWQITQAKAVSRRARAEIQAVDQSFRPK